MLEKYYVRPETVDQVRALWLGSAIESYVSWLDQNNYRDRTVLRRIPIAVSFSKFAQSRGISKIEELPAQVEPFVLKWVSKHARSHVDKQRRKRMGNEIRNIIRQMLRVIIPGYQGLGRPHKPDNPFEKTAPRFFLYLKNDKGLSDCTLEYYRHYLRQFAAYLQDIGMNDIKQLSPAIISGFIIKYRQRIKKAGVRDACGVIRVFLRYLYHENILKKDLSQSIDFPKHYRFSEIPRSMSWEQVKQVLEMIDRRSPIGKRDYAMLLLLSLYGLRAREIVAMTLDDFDWRNERLRVPERKAGHSTGYPLSPIVSEAIVDYLKHGRPLSKDRHLFFRTCAPFTPITNAVISCRCAYYIHKAGIKVPRAGSHTFRHSCVQKLVNAHFSLKSIGDYVGHRDPSSTQIYGKVAVEDLRALALGDAEEVLS